MRKGFLVVLPLALPLGIPAVFAVFYGACSGPVLSGPLTPVFPALPVHWETALGEASWLVEWKGANGKTEKMIVAAGDKPAPISFQAEWPNPVTAWPFWPGSAGTGLEPGLFYPAGALYPFDAVRGKVTLSWRGGADTAFYRALESAVLEDGDAISNPLRRPWFFNWPRFRSVIRNNAPEPVKADPWLADWKGAAAKTIRSSFREAYIKEAPREARSVHFPSGGVWISGSPFKAPEFRSAGEILQIALGEERDVWYCTSDAEGRGILTLSKKAQVWRPMDTP